MYRAYIPCYILLGDNTKNMKRSCNSYENTILFYFCIKDLNICRVWYLWGLPDPISPWKPRDCYISPWLNFLTNLRLEMLTKYEMLVKCQVIDQWWHLIRMIRAATSSLRPWKSCLVRQMAAGMTINLSYLGTSAFLTWSFLPLGAPMEAASPHIPETCGRVSSSESGFFLHSQPKADGGRRPK